MPDSERERDLRAQITQLRAEVRGARGRAAEVPLRVGSGGGNIASHSVFPAIPDYPTTIFCHGQEWFATEGWTVWRPKELFSTYDGTPGT